MYMPHGDAESWKLKSIKWRLVFWFQDYGVLLAAFTFLALFIHQTKTGYPVHRSALIYDSTISQPHVKSYTLESYQAALVPILFLIGTLTFNEFVIFQSFNSITNALIAWVHFTISSLSAWTTAVWVTAFFKNYAGRLRPDFFARCKPLLDGGRKWDAHLDYAKFVEVTCSRDDPRKIAHGRFSFPSQHSTWAMVCAWYSIMYMSWTFYSRMGGIMQRHRFGHSKLGSRIAREVLAYFGFMILAAQMFYVWIIGVNRFRENRHNISDIVAGWFMGFIISSFYAMRAIYVYSANRQNIIDAENRIITTGQMWCPEEEGSLTRAELAEARGLRTPLLDGANGQNGASGAGDA